MKSKKDYSKGKIYRIVCNETGLVYVGHTCETINQRLKRHERYFRELEKGGRGVPNSVIVIANQDYKIELIENFPCKSDQELRWRERYWIEQTPRDVVVNEMRPIISHEELVQWRKEYYEKNKDKIKEYKAKWNQLNYEPSYSQVLTSLFETSEDRQQKVQEQHQRKLESNKKYREANKELLNEKKQQYYQDNDEYRSACKERAKKQREENKEAIKEYKRQYYLQNKARINAKHKENYEKRKSKN